MRGSSTSRICRLPASKTSPTIRRSSTLSVWVPVTSSRTSCSVIAWRPCLGSPPSSVTTTLTVTDSSQTTGRASVAIRSSSGAANSASGTVRCSAIRLGASSPSTRLTNVMHTVTIAKASGERHRAGHVVPDQPAVQQPDERVGAERAGHQRRQRHADLHGGQEPVRVRRELRGLRAALAAPAQRPHLALAERDQRHLRGREEPADGHDDEDDDHVQDDPAHAAIADFLRCPPVDCCPGRVSALLRPGQFLRASVNGITFAPVEAAVPGRGELSRRGDVSAAMSTEAWFAPGRANLMGEHTDYNEGFVLPFALAQGVTATAAAREDGLLVLRSRQKPAEPVTLVARRAGAPLGDRVGGVPGRGGLGAAGGRARHRRRLDRHRLRPAGRRGRVVLGRARVLGRAGAVLAVRPVGAAGAAGA